MRVRPIPILLLSLLLAAPFLPDGRATAQERPTRARFEAPAGGSLLVHGEYPPVRSSCVRPTQPLVHARFRGAVEVGRASDGSLFLIGETHFEDYLKGIAEVPRSWPMAALKAQVVAARSYAMVQLSQADPLGDALGYDLCATDACQVYVGMGVEAGPFGDRWTQAVEETAGEVLLYQGRPAETFYFSTSNGRTYTNQEIWGTDPLPYLPSVEERDDGESPLSRWSVRIPFRDLSRFLRAAGQWDGGAIRGVTWRDGEVVLRGDGRARLSKADLRNALNGTAPCLDPDDYPPPREDGSRPPQTVPSIWYELRREGRSVVLDGRGWGHGIGMVQWGAKGKADRGLGYGDILAAYYGGLRPERVASPGTIRVLIAEGLRSATVAPSDRAQVRIGDRRGAVDRPLRVTPVRRRIRARPAPVPDPLLSLSGFRLGRGGEVTAEATSSAPVRARIELLRGGEVVETGPWESQREERFGLTVPMPEDPAGLRVRIRATDGVDQLTTETRRLRAAPAEGGVTPTPSPSPTTMPSPTTESSPTPRIEAAPAGDEDGSGAPLAAAAGLLAAGAAVLALTWRRRRRLHRRR